MGKSKEIILEIILFTYLFNLFIVPLNAQYITEGGNITEMNMSSNNSADDWGGAYGEVINSGVQDYILYKTNNTIRKIDLNYNLLPNCQLDGIYVIAYNQTINPPLRAGNLTLLDEIINSSENASKTFTHNESLELSYGTINNVPYTYTYSNPGNVFKTYYLNDNNNAIIFIANIVNNQNDWNGTTSDYQILIVNNGGNFTLTTDLRTTCTGGIGKKQHEIYILPIHSITLKIGENYNGNATVENIGDYNERDINTYLISPDEIESLIETIGYLAKGGEKQVEFIIHGNEIGTFVYAVKAKNDKARYTREFLVKVLPECEEDSECGSGEYCNSGVCEKEEFCITSFECKDNEVCFNGSCSEISCGCGYVSNHECINYECCEDKDCGLNEICYEHECEELRPNLEFNETEPGGDLIIVVTDPFGNPWIGSVIIDGIEYDLVDGKAIVPRPKDKVAYVVKGKNKYGFILPLKEMAEIIIPSTVYVNEKINGRVSDELGRPIGKAKIIIMKGDEIIKEVYTDKNSRFYFVVDKEGIYKIKGISDDYYIKEVEFKAIIRKCEFPYGTKLVVLEGSKTNYLWLPALILAVLFVVIAGNKIVYYTIALIPLLLAVPGEGMLSICFMVNIELLEVILASLIKGIKKAIKKKK